MLTSASGFVTGTSSSSLVLLFTACAHECNSPLWWGLMKVTSPPSLFNYFHVTTSQSSQNFFSSFLFLKFQIWEVIFNNILGLFTTWNTAIEPNNHRSKEPVTMSRLNINWTSCWNNVKTHVGLDIKEISESCEFCLSWRGSARANYSRYKVSTLSNPLPGHRGHRWERS